MSRLRNVGKQAAGDDDVLTLRVQRAFEATLPGLYLQNSRLNQPLGAPQLDSNGRMENTYLPTDISRTTLTATGKGTVGSLESKGAAKVASLDISSVDGQGATVPGDLTGVRDVTASGVLRGASEILTGNIQAATQTIPENTATTYKAKATTLDSLTVSGVTTLQGALNALSIATSADVTVGGKATVTGDLVSSTGDVKGRDGILSRNLIASGYGQVNGDMDVRGSLRAKNTDGTAKVLAIAGDATATGTLRGAALTTPGNVVATGQVSGGSLYTDGTLDVTGAADVGSVTSAAGIIAQGDIQSVGALKGATAAISGALSAGASTLGSIGTGSITASGTVNVDSQVHIAKTMAVDASHLLINGKFIRQWNSRWETYLTAQGKWVPNFAGAMMKVMANPGSSGGSGQDIYDGQQTTVQMPTLVSNDASLNAVFVQFNQGIRVLVPGLYMFTAIVTCAMLGQRGGQVGGFGINGGTWQSDSTQQQRTGGQIDTWSQMSMNLHWVRRLSANDYINVKFFATNNGFQTDINSDSDTIYRTQMTGVFLGN